MGIYIQGLATRLGSQRIAAAEIEKYFNKLEGFIEQISGVTALHRFSPHESLVGSSAEALKEAASNADISEKEINGIFSSSNASGDYLIPGLASLVGNTLGLTNIPMLSVGMGCVGGIHALQSAYNQLRVDELNGRKRNYAVVVGDQTSRILDPSEWKTGYLFSEGTAALIISNDAGKPGYRIDKIESSTLAGNPLVLSLPNPLAHEGETVSAARFSMDGRKVFDFGSSVFPHILSMLDFCAMPKNSYLIPHQANLKMLDKIIELNNLNPERVYVDGIKRIGNTSGPAFMFGLEDAIQRELIKKGDDVLIGTFGAELAIGAAYLSPHGNPRAALKSK